ncbi:MAG TPA: hypothetical protein VFB13_08925 [Reyranella sp.]|jgi:hypothetical protein|nr:hypothetical protein [Reyranella sp.]
MAVSRRAQIAFGMLAVVAVIGALTVGFNLMNGEHLSTVPGHWRESQRSAFIEACNTNCKNSPGVTADRYPLCEKVCACSATEGEKILSEADLAEIVAAGRNGQASLEQNEKMQKLTKVAHDCTAAAGKASP